jgi:hypothetical protein
MSSTEVFQIYIDDAGSYFAHIAGKGHEALNVTLSGSAATVGSPLARSGELLPLSLDDAGHLYVHEDGRYTSVGTDHGKPVFTAHSVYPLAVDKSGNLLKFIKGQWLTATYVA